MTIPFNGTLVIQTVGWTRWAVSSIWVLIPGTLVALATIVVVLVVVGKHSGGTPSDQFDPGNAMHLISAAAAGGLSDTFTGIDENGLEAGERVQIHLGFKEGHGPALLRT
jgi:hypothetical protein